MAPRSYVISLSVVSVFLFSLMCSTSQAKTIYVDDDATGANNGTSWTDAYVYLQDALADANSAEKPVEIRVAQGTYKPDQGANQTPGDREATFQLINGATLSGGYAGLSEPSPPNARDVGLYESILSGDLDGDDDPNSTNNSENSYHVVTGSQTDKTAMLDGFVISAGNANGPIFENEGFDNFRLRCGGGIYNFEGSPTLNNCTFSNNSAEYRGGGIYNLLRSSPALTNCNFSGNTVMSQVFPEGLGGGMYNYASTPILTNCTFSGNSGAFGGGISNHDSSPTLTNCTFSGNSAQWNGGGMSNYDDSRPILTNCTFAQNHAQKGNAIACNWFYMSSNSDVRLINCILWNGGDEIWNNDHSAIVISYSNIQGGFPGNGNIDVDPLFVASGYCANVNDPNTVVEPNDPNAIWIDGDYHLKSKAGRWDPVSESWVKDDVTSPCIDAGDPNSDWGDEVWPHGGRINMGAYGGTSQASMSAEPQAMSLPRVAYIYYNKIDMAEGYKALLNAHGCTITLVPGDQVETTAFDNYDLIIAGTDTGYSNVWTDEKNIAAVEGSGKPVLGLGSGGYWYFGYLGLTIGRPNGGHDSGGAIEPVDPNNPLFNEPYPVEIPESGVLELCAETDQINIYLYPAPPDTVTTLGQDAGNPGYYSLVLENDRYLFWGFEGSAESLTESGAKLFINAVIRTANTAWMVETK